MGWRKPISHPQSNQHLWTGVNTKNQFVFFCYYWRSKQSQEHSRGFLVSAGKWEGVKTASLAEQGTKCQLPHPKHGDPTGKPLSLHASSPRGGHRGPSSITDLQDPRHASSPYTVHNDQITTLLQWRQICFHKTSQHSKYFLLAFLWGKSVQLVSVREITELLLIWWHSLS